MKKLVLLIGAIACFANSYGQAGIHIIPEPVKAVIQKGHFKLPETVTISGPSEADLGETIEILNRRLRTSTGRNVKLIKGKEAAIQLVLNKKNNPKIGEEGYQLSVGTKKVILTANRPAGLFYGVQSLLQLFPPQIMSDSGNCGVAWEAPCVDITDYPRFKWRGLMLDVGRHFFSKEFVKSYIDEMARYKMNSFHWHLADDQGWRVEIKGLPKVTEIGAWRVPRTGQWGTFEGPEPGEKATEGGYYTQEDIKEMVAYAQQRFVTIVPEIDVPGHSLALIASYPNLSCTKEQYQVWPQYQPEGIDNVLCVANDSTWLFLDKIFTQVAQLFPGEYIHVGGDEANRDYWMKDPKDIALMQKEGIETPAGLQSYFEKKLEKMIVSKGKRMIGWDEILEGGLAPEATVMSWRGTKGGIEAAKMGHHVVMSPMSNCYIDYYQGDPLTEPYTFGMLRLSQCYGYEPVPDGIDPKYILGGQGNLWTESVPDERHAQYMTWPRALALSEVWWSPKEKKDWPKFVEKTMQQFKYLDYAQVKYATTLYDPIIYGAKDDKGNLYVDLSTEVPGLDIYYTFDGTNPDNFYSKYKGKALPIPVGASEIRVVTYYKGKPIGKQINCPLSEVAKRAAK